jgi:dTDP-4-amino-4,6-dideoxygalactose transaminase
VAEIYDNVLSRSGPIAPMTPGPESRPSYWRYTGFLDSQQDRNEVKQRLQALGITTDWAYSPPVHLQPVFQQLFSTRAGMFPKAESLMARHICLPIHARLRNCDADYVAQSIAHL